MVKTKAVTIYLKDLIIFIDLATSCQIFFIALIKPLPSVLNENIFRCISMYCHKFKMIILTCLDIILSTNCWHHRIKESCSRAAAGSVNQLLIVLPLLSHTHLLFFFFLTKMMIWLILNPLFMLGYEKRDFKVALYSHCNMLWLSKPCTCCEQSR